jgi:hypothetical protein
MAGGIRLQKAFERTIECGTHGVVPVASVPDGYPASLIVIGEKSGCPGCIREETARRRQAEWEKKRRLDAEKEKVRQEKKERLERAVDADVVLVQTCDTFEEILQAPATKLFFTDKATELRAVIEKRRSELADLEAKLAAAERSVEDAAAKDAARAAAHASLSASLEASQIAWSVVSRLKREEKRNVAINRRARSLLGENP